MRPFPVKLVLAICMVPAAVLSQPKGGATALGMLIQASGQVFIQRGTAKTEARLADLLYTGDEIITAAGEAVVMYCPSSERLVVPRNVTLELRADGIRVLKGSAPAKAPAKCLLPRVALGAESLERMGAFRARGSHPIIQYLGGPVSTDRPTLVWGTVEGSPVFRVVLKDAERDVVVWEMQTTSLTASYPESMRPLAKGSYEWEVRAEAGGQTVAEGSANLEIKPSAELSKAADQDSGLVRALELESAGYYAEAAAYFRKLRETDPKDERLARHLAWLYWNAGLIQAFNEESKQLKPQ